MFVISDLDEVYFPCHDDILVSITEAKQMLIPFLEKLPRIFKNNNNPSNCFGRVLQFSHKLIVVYC